MRRGLVVAVLLMGVAVGYAAAIVLSSPQPVEPASTPTLQLQVSTITSPTEAAASRTSTTTTSPPTSAAAPNDTGSGATTYLIWSTGGLTPPLVEGLPGLFPNTSIVYGDVVELDVAGGVVPLDALAIDPVEHRPFDPADTLSALEPGTVALSTTSARLRDAEIGATLMLEDRPYRVTAIVPDEVVSAAEVVFHRADPDPLVVTPRFALVATVMPREQIEEMARSLYDGPASLRIRAAGETPWLRHGDAVLPQVYIKEALGEFSYTGLAGAEFRQDQSFRDQNIVTANVPILGEVVCHRIVVEMLTTAMTRLVEEGLAHLVDPAGFAGCWYPRFIRSATGLPSGVSRHAWGAAVDLNAPANPMGSTGTQDPRLVEIMLDAGFTWGGDWLVPDPMHFEYG